MIALLCALALAEPPAAEPSAAEPAAEPSAAEPAIEAAQAIDAGAVNADQYLNLGLALQEQQPELATLSYRRGLMLSPQDPELRLGLDRLDAAPPELPWIPVAWAGWGAVLSLSVALVFGVLWRLSHRRRWVWLSAPLLMLFAGLGSETYRQISGWGQRALVLEQSAPVYAQPQAGLQLFELPALSEVTLGPSQQGATQVRTADGRMGWMSASSLGVLDPRAPAPALR